MDTACSFAGQRSKLVSGRINVVFYLFHFFYYVFLRKCLCKFDLMFLIQTNERANEHGIQRCTATISYIRLADRLSKSLWIPNWNSGYVSLDSWKSWARIYSIPIFPSFWIHAPSRSMTNSVPSIGSQDFDSKFHIELKLIPRWSAGFADERNQFDIRHSSCVCFPTTEDLCRWDGGSKQVTLHESIIIELFFWNVHT